MRTKFVSGRGMFNYIFISITHLDIKLIDIKNLIILIIVYLKKNGINDMHKLFHLNSRSRYAMESASWDTIIVRQQSVEY